MNVTFNDNKNNPYLSLHKSNIQRDYNYLSKSSTQSFKGLEQFAERTATRLVSNKKVQELLQKPGFNKLLKTAIENPGFYEAFIALLITCTARPLTILATPGAKMEDKQYASAQSMASGISGLLFSYAIFDPITQAIDNILVNVNGKNVKTAFKNFYNNPENAETIQQLAEKKIIPDTKTFAENVDKTKNIFGYMKEFLKDNGGKQFIDELLSGEDAASKKEWITLAEKFSNGLNNAYNKVKFDGISTVKKYLVHDTLEFIKEGGYKLKQSMGADKTKFLINYSSKILLFPITAGVTVWAIPKVMKLVFPNHKKSKKSNNTTPNKQETTKQNTTEKLSDQKNTTKIFKNFKAQNHTNQTVSFSGGLGSVGKIANNIYEKGYKTPLAAVLTAIFDKITYSNKFEQKIKTLLEKAPVTKHGLETLNRDKSGKILLKWDNDFITSNLPDIGAVFGSCLYIFNTIRNKEIDPERKPALCTNMALVAVFSLFASSGLKKLSQPIFNALNKTHFGLMKDKLNYDHNAAWDCARKLLTTTFAFRYVGPVLATPAADKLVKLFGKPQDAKKG